MDARPELQRRLLAGSVGPERQPVRPDAAERWFEALHVRDPRGARERLASQVAAGADVVVAPTWQTHRRALLAVGETRRARAWTAAAIRIGREAIEVGLERRGDDTVQGGDDRADGDPASPDGPIARVGPAAAAGPAAPVIPPHLRPTPLLAASLPALDETPESGTGRLLPSEAASERDYRDQAGLLADGAPDLILVEGNSTIAEARVAVEAAFDTGLPVWVALAGLPADTDAPARLIDALGGRSVDCLLLGGTPPDHPPSPPTAWGGLLGTSAIGATADAWLDAGARVLAVLDGATPGRLDPVRAAIDRAEETARLAAHVAEERWWEHVQQAAAMAEGGTAVWIVAPGGQAPLADRLPGGFDWLVVPHDEVRQLPDGRFRLVASPAVAGGNATGSGGRATGYGRLLDDGGILAWAGDPGAANGAGLRMVVMDTSQIPALAIMRREP